MPPSSGENISNKPGEIKTFSDPNFTPIASLNDQVDDASDDDAQRGGGDQGVPPPPG